MQTAEDDACLGDDTVAGFLDGALDRNQSTRVRGHLDACEECRRLLADATAARSSRPPPREVSTEPVAPGQILADKYELLRVIGRGGMGELFAARHIALDQPVAIKVLHGSLFADDDSVRRFMREARVAARLKSRHAVRIFDVDLLASGLPYLVMELLEGEDLAALLARRPLGVDEAVGYVLQAAEALAEAHALGLVHRDIKPQNLFLTQVAQEGPRVKVIDFGLVKELHQPPLEAALRTADDVVLGSPEFMSPEQVRGAGDVDARTDIWALGATLFRLLTGRSAFEGANLATLFSNILETPAPSASRYRPDVPPAIARVVARALEKSPAARYRDAEELIAALREVVNATDVMPAPRSTLDATPTFAVGSAATLPLVPDAALQHASQLLPGVRTGRFRIDGWLGAGGMGDVFRAHDRVLDRAVALKVLRMTAGIDDTRQRRRVVREARAAAALTHANVVTIFDVGEDEMGVFIAMELLEGESLRAFIARGDAPLGTRLRWLVESASALSSAHARGLVHRDVKPENMFICADGSLRLLDFGIAKQGGENDLHLADGSPDSLGPSSMQTRAGRRLGTPRYMAPEQRAGESTDARADQYAWGLVAIELLSAAPGGDALDTTEPLALHARADALPRPLGAALRRAVQPLRDDRFPSMAALVDVLTTSADDPSPVAAQARTSSRRWPRVLTLSVAVAIMGAASTLAARRWLGRASPDVCEAGPRLQVPTGPLDRVGLDATGAILVARSGGGSLQVERHDRSGSQPLALPASMPLSEDDLGDVDVGGTTLMGSPALSLVTRTRPDLGAIVTVITADGSYSSQRVFGPVTGIAATTFRDAPVVIAATVPGAPRRMDLPDAVELYARGAADRVLLERGGGAAPAVAAAEDSLAIVYTNAHGLRFALVDRFFKRVGDVKPISTTSAAAAIAFDGRLASVFWIEDGRLMNANLTIGQDAFTPPHPAVDEHVSGERPVAVEMSRHRWAIAWVREESGGSSLRFAALDATARLSPAIDVARARSITGVQAGAGARDAATLLWREAPEGARVAEVMCGPAPR